jgi:hypothetical protein
MATSQARRISTTSADAILIGAVLLERNDEWQLQHRSMQVEAMAELTAEPEPAQLPPQAARPVATSVALESTPP